MGEELSQDEIDAMLSQMAGGGGDPAPAVAPPVAETTAPASSPSAQPFDAPIASSATSAPQGAAAAKFNSFDGSASANFSNSDIAMLLDVPMEVTAELGRTSMYIKDILNLGPGSVIEIDRLAGEPIELLVNGKIIAKGEVVVIDERFGVRITELLNPSGEMSPN